MKALAFDNHPLAYRDLDEDRQVVQDARAMMREEAEAIMALSQRIDARFAEAVRILLETRGRVILTGIGKSGHIGRKIAATLASTGTAAFFVHAAEAAHGDLGMITPGDTVILLSYSGETAEVLRLTDTIRALGVPMIAMVGNLESRLARAVDLALDVGVESEICPNNLAPTSSTLSTLAMGDVLAMTLARKKAFNPEQFGRVHPGGCLGRRVAQKVADTMRTENLPILSLTATLGDALLTAERGKLGVAVIVDDEGVVHGIVGPNELERALVEDREELAVTVMKADYQGVTPDSMLEQANRRMRFAGLPALPVIDAGRRLLGIVERDD
ncbi:MAG: KpsF/GutQ family sugar-phosphate isomerase [Sandaracinaceae bacterium]|nr:KpsF/GutQ family sugar-phosphate isomerase [Sandaracinaceae bacterium]